MNRSKTLRQQAYGCAFKKPSIKEQRDRQTRARKKPDKSKWTENERQVLKYGIFNKKGYVMIMGFETREEAEEKLQSFCKYGKLYEVREITWYEE